MTKAVRIGNAQAFWGDRTDAAAEMLALEPDLDYLTLDYLAEVSMSILALQRDRDPTAGFARDFVDVVQSLVPYWLAGGRCRLIANAGGLNPRGCADACCAALAAAGCRPLRIGVVAGDDVLQRVRDMSVESSTILRNLGSGAEISTIRDRLVTANAYLGAAPIVDALSGGADIVITGRVADPSLTVAACIHHFGWSDDDLNQLAGATVAGHLIECGTQVTGGISTDWLNMSDADDIGFPIVEVESDGSCVVTKPQGSGGQVTEMTVKEQLVYEIGDPANYLSPDVAVSFLSLVVEVLGGDRVRVSGAIGKPRPSSYKVSATFRDGFRSAGTLTIIGKDSAAKARRCGEHVLQRVYDAGFEVRDYIVECLGSGDGTGGVIRPRDNDGGGCTETVLRIAVESDSLEAVERFAREIIPLVTAGPQGTTGYAEGRPRVHPVFRYWPCLILRNAISANVEYVTSHETSAGESFNAGQMELRRPRKKRSSPKADGIARPKSNRTNRPCRLYDIACARSGDKGINANVGVIVRSNEWWEFLRIWLTAERVSKFFSPLGIQSVDRYELPNLGGLNFVLGGALQRQLRTDAQGKALGQILLSMSLPADARGTIA